MTVTAQAFVADRPTGPAVPFPHIHTARTFLQSRGAHLGQLGTAAQAETWVSGRITWRIR